MSRSAAFYLGLHCSPKNPFICFQYVKNYDNHFLLQDMLSKLVIFDEVIVCWFLSQSSKQYGGLGHFNVFVPRRRNPDLILTFSWIQPPGGRRLISVK